MKAERHGAPENELFSACAPISAFAPAPRAPRWWRALLYGTVWVSVPALVALGVWVFADRAYGWISLCIAVLSCIPFFLRFEHGRVPLPRMILLAVMTALSVLGRFAFAALAHFKPVSAMVIVCGMCMGAESGFLCGALTAVLSNMLFGQGPWTPFQMFAWGLIGFLSGVLRRVLEKNRALMLLWGALAGFLFSALMDLWTTVWIDGTFTLSRYLAAQLSAFPITLIYAGSNVIFLLVLALPIRKKLNRVLFKYGI